MSASAVQICNLALMKFGTAAIAALTDESKEARACNVFYPLMRDELLHQYPWNFAMKRADISAQLADAPAFGFDYAYSLPADCLRAWELQGDAEWVIEGGLLLTNQDSGIYLRYIAAITETGRFNPAFVNCLATRLGAELAAKLADDKNQRLTMLDELYKILLPTAYELNAIEGNRPRNKDVQALDQGNFSWVKEGR